MNELLEVIEKEAALKKENLNKEIKCLDKGFVRLVDFLGTDSSIVQAARVSYGKGTKQKSEDRGLIRYLVSKRHTSPLEMVEFKFHCKMPIVVARQWVRHRTASLNEYSGRYSEMPNECYVPELDRLQVQSNTNKQGSEQELVSNPEVIQALMQAEQLSDFDKYDIYLKTGLSREMSRINLPLSTYTQWYWKMDLHNLFHFLKLRLDEHAQYEIRVYAEAIYELIKPIVPISCAAFEDYVLNAVTFSRQEMITLKNIIKEVKNIEMMGLNDREMKEFFQKVGMIMSTSS